MPTGDGRGRAGGGGFGVANGGAHRGWWVTEMNRATGVTTALAGRRRAPVAGCARAFPFGGASTDASSQAGGGPRAGLIRSGSSGSPMWVQRREGELLVASALGLGKAIDDLLCADLLTALWGGRRGGRTRAAPGGGPVRRWPRPPAVSLVLRPLLHPTTRRLARKVRNVRSGRTEQTIIPSTA